MDLSIFKLFISIGAFKLSRKDETSVGYIREYVYQPSYLNGRHYTMVIFRYKNYKYVDYRLYIHNKDGSFYKSLFQVSDRGKWNKEKLTKELNSIFKRELLVYKINKIINKL